MNKIAAFLFLLVSFTVSAQKTSLDTLVSLPGILTEISAMEMAKDGNVWTINDSGNEPYLYLIDEKGKIVKDIFIANATNTDWEELTKDDNGNIYIGDFGNNRNNRQDLKVYIVSEDDLLSRDTVSASQITFKYADQYAFPPAEEKQNFDLEAMVFYKNRLILFSKNRTKPFTGYANLYQLPTVPGDYVAEKIDSIKLGDGPRELYQVTAASISPDGSRLALMSYDKCFLIHDFPFADLIGGRVEEIVFDEVSQKESVCWNSDSTLLISDEKSVLGGGFLYQLNISSNIKENSKVRRSEVKLPVKEFGDTLVVKFTTEVRGKVYYEFYSGEGDRVNFGTIGYFDRGEHQVDLVPKDFKNGMYMLNIQIGSRPHAFFVYRHKPVDWEKIKEEFKYKGGTEGQKRQTSEPER